MLARVEMNRDGLSVTGRIVARRPKTRQVYVVIDHESGEFDNWFPASIWTEIAEE